MRRSKLLLDNKSTVALIKSSEQMTKISIGEMGHRLVNPLFTRLISG